MNCRDFQQFLQSGLDRDSDAAADLPEVERHLANCHSCRELHAAALRLVEGVSLTSWPQPPPDLFRRTVSRVLRDRRPGPSRFAVAALAIAASIALMALFYRREPVPVVSVAPAEPSRAELPTTFPLDTHEVGQAVAALAQRTAGETIGQTRFLVPLVAGKPRIGPPSFRSLPSDPSANSFQAVAFGVGNGLKPITDSALRAVNLFMRQVPGVETQRRTG